MAQIKFRNPANSAWERPKAIRTWDGNQWVRHKGYRWTDSAWDSIITYPHYVITDGSLGTYTFETIGDGYTERGQVSNYYRVFANGTEAFAYLWLRTVQKIDLTQYSKLYLDFSLDDPSGSGNSAFGVVNAEPFAWAWVASNHQNETMTRQVKSLDIGGLSGNYSVGLYLDDSGNSFTEMRVYNMWLE